MRKLLVRLGLVLSGMVVVWSAAGCGDDKRREVRVHEEQRPGEVREVAPGEMVVE